MERKILFQILGMVAFVWISSCTEPLTFQNIESPGIPVANEATARLLWIGPDYKVVVSATLEDNHGGISKLRIKNGEWQLDHVMTIDNQASYIVNDTFLVAKDVNPTEHVMELTITNSKGGVLKTNVNVEDLSAVNQIEGYSADVLPPVINVVKPQVTKFYGLDDQPINLDVDATITDAEIASIEVKVWGETAQGEFVAQEELITPATDEEKINYHYINTFTLPAGKVGEYQYIIRSTDTKGNKAVKGGNITVGYVDRLYLSDAENADEALNQGYDNYGACRGIGTLLSMRKQGNNVFVADYYYRNEANDNIRFVAFLGNDRPFSTNGATVNYTLDGFNVLASSASEPGKVTPDLSVANFKLPASEKGYYHITVDMTARTISVTPFTPTIPVDASKYPGWSDDNPWPYMAVTGPTVVGSSGAWSETATSPLLTKEEGHAYLYSGSFTTTGSSSNMSLNAPKTVVGANNVGWFRLKAARTSMLDDYGDKITIVSPVGASSGGANWGFSLSPVGTYKATYDIALHRFRIVRTN